MKYHSTNQPQLTVSMQEAITTSVPVCGGLYMPASLPKIPLAFIQNMSDMSLREIAYVTSNVFLGDDLDSKTIKTIVDNALSFDIPLVEITETLYALELFHGPTGVFKDIGARFLAGLLSAITKGVDQTLNVLVSTTGNTGMAVANAYANHYGVNVFILYPYGAVSKESAAEMMAMGDNIHAIEVSGNIDDCKSIIESAFADKSLRENILLSTANSTNFARLIPQLALFFYATAQLARKGIKPSDYDIAVPSGNLGLLTAGVMAKKIGLQCGKIIAACNANNAFDRLLKTGNFERHATVKTLAPLMDIAVPSNLPRLLALEGGTLESLRATVSSVTIDDEYIRQTVRNTASNYGYIADPHTAVGIAALQLRDDNRPGLVFATAAPSRSIKLMNEILGDVFIGTDSENNIHLAKRKSERIAPTYPAFKKYLLAHQ